MKTKIYSFGNIELFYHRRFKCWLLHYDFTWYRVPKKIALQIRSCLSIFELIDNNGLKNIKCL